MIDFWWGVLVGGLVGYGCAGVVLWSCRYIIRDAIIYKHEYDRRQDNV